MKFRKIFALIVLCLCLCSSSFSQIFEMSSDARWIALGQATDGYDGFGSTRHFLTSSSSRFAELNYGSRPVNWISGFDMRYWHMSIFASLDSAQWARATYQRFDYPEFPFTGPSDPTVITAKPNEVILGLSYGRQLAEHFFANFTYKYYRLADYPSFEGGTVEPRWISSTAHIGDATIAYEHPLIDNNAFSNRIGLLAGVTNFGTWIVHDNDKLQPITRFGRLGMIVSNALLNSEGNRIVSAILSFNYRRLLNMPESTLRNYWSGGVEVGAYDIVFLRAGLRVDPFASLYGPSDKALGSYGVGIQLPLEMISQHLNGLALRFDYAAVPLEESNPSGFYLTPVKYNKTYCASISHDFSRGGLF